MVNSEKGKVGNCDVRCMWFNLVSYLLETHSTSELLFSEIKVNHAPVIRN